MCFHPKSAWPEKVSDIWIAQMCLSYIWEPIWTARCGSATFGSQFGLHGCGSATFGSPFGLHRCGSITFGDSFGLHRCDTRPGRPGMGGRLIGGGIYRHRFGHQSGPEQSSRKNSAAILRKISARIFSAFSKIEEKRLNKEKSRKHYYK